MDYDSFIVKDAEDAVHYLIVNETLLRSARGLYNEIFANKVAMGDEGREFTLDELEEYGKKLVRCKQQVLNHLTLAAFPFTIAEEPKRR